MNRRGFLKGTLTVDLVAAIVKGRLLDVDTAPEIMRSGEIGTYEGMTIIESTPSGQVWDVPRPGWHQFYDKLTQDELHVSHSHAAGMTNVTRYAEAVWGEAA